MHTTAAKWKRENEQNNSLAVQQLFVCKIFFTVCLLPCSALYNLLCG